MSLFQKIFSSEAKKDPAPSWVVILKGIADPKSEEALVRVFHQRLEIPREDGLKIVRSAPLILFDERTVEEAEQIKMILNQVGAQTAISNDPDEFNRLGRVLWPKRVEADRLGAGLDAGASTPPSAKPAATSPVAEPVIPSPPKPEPRLPKAKPTPPKAEVPPPPPVNEWRARYEERIKRLEGEIAQLRKELIRHREI